MQKHHREKDAQKTARIVHVKSEGQGTSILGMWLVEMENTERNFRITKKKNLTYSLISRGGKDGGR